MKILFTLTPPQGSYGGGAFFVRNMTDQLIKQGHTIIKTLDNEIDIIVIIDPRRDQYNNYSYSDIATYKKTHPTVKIIHRINENDKKRTNSINIEPIIIETMKIADQIIFVSYWLHDYYNQKYNLIRDHGIVAKMNIIYSGVDTLTYCPLSNFLTRNHTIENRKIRVVTHHWSNNYLKGFEVYRYLDKYISEHPDCGIEFIYIGNYNYDTYKPIATTIYPPLSPSEIAKLLKNADIYLTATQYEPGAMHYLEAMACGLPIVNRTNGGGTHEICKDCGIQFDKPEECIEALITVMENRTKYINNIDFDYISKERCVGDVGEVLGIL